MMCDVQALLVQNSVIVLLIHQYKDVSPARKLGFLALLLSWAACELGQADGGLSSLAACRLGLMCVVVSRQLVCAVLTHANVLT